MAIVEQVTSGLLPTIIFTVTYPGKGPLGPTMPAGNSMTLADLWNSDLRSTSATFATALTERIDP
jgi:hypothetical protein